MTSHQRNYTRCTFKHYSKELGINVLVRIFLLIALIQNDAHASNLLADPNFESGNQPGVGWSGSFGRWEEDAATVLGATQGVVPANGSYQLRFDATGPTGANGVYGQVVQFVDIRSINSSPLRIYASAWFNRVSGINVDTQFNLVIVALTGGFGDAYAVNRFSKSIITDANTATWEQAMLHGLVVPAGTEFIRFQMEAVENVFNDTIAGNEFAGHFADAVYLGATPFSADFDFDRDVDAFDLIYWKNGFGMKSAVTQLQGDADSDGVVDGTDFLIWQRSVGRASAVAAASPIPEPATGALAALFMLIALRKLLTRCRVGAGFST